MVFKINTMNLGNSINKVLNSKLTATVLYTTAGVGKIAYDCKKAAPEDKKDTLISEGTIFASSALGMFLYTSAKKNIASMKLVSSISNSVKNKINSSKINKKTRTVLKKCAEISWDCADNILLIVSGIVGSISSNELIKNVHFKKIDKKIMTKKQEVANIEKQKESAFQKSSTEFPANNVSNLNRNPQNKDATASETKKVKDLPPNKSNLSDKPIPPKESLEAQKKDLGIFDIFKNKITGEELKNNIKIYMSSETSQNIVSNITNVPEMKILTNTAIGLQALKINEERNFKAKMRKMTKEIVSNTLLPVFFMSTAANLTKNVRALYRTPIVLTTMVLGPIITSKIWHVIYENKYVNNSK